MKKVDKSSSAIAKAEGSTNADDSQACQPIAKPNVVRSCFIVNEIYLDLPISRVDKVFEANEAACKYASEMNELVERLHQKIEYRVLEAEIVPA